MPLADISLLQEFTCIDPTALLSIGNSSSGPGIIYERNGPSTNNVQSTTLAPTEPGLYHLTVFNQSSGCQSVDSMVLLLPEAPYGLEADIEIPICAGDFSGSLLVTNVSGGTPVYMYSLNGDPLTANPFYGELMSGNYTIEVVDTKSCSNSQSFIIQDGQSLTIDVGANIEPDLGDSVILNANVSLPWSQIDSIVWSPGVHLSCTHCTNPTFYGFFNEVITATVYANGCIDEDMLIIRVDMDALVYIPNVFSPNGDNVNDLVTVYADPGVKRVVVFEIFDRWGNNVFINADFLPNEPRFGWDGRFRDIMMNLAVFAYRAVVELVNGRQVTHKGNITLAR